MEYISEITEEDPKRAEEERDVGRRSAEKCQVLPGGKMY